MTIKKLATIVGVLALVAAIGVLTVSSVFAQSGTTTPAPEKTPKLAPFGRGFGFGGHGDWAKDFDAIAAALNLTPTQLFEQLHSGKTLAEIAEAQGVDLAKVQEAANAARVQAQKDAIAKAVEEGKITQEQADWLLEGLEKGYMGKGRGFGFGFDGMRGGMRGHGFRGFKTLPATPAPGTSS